MGGEQQRPGVTPTGDDGSPIRVIFLAHYFPRPNNMMMGTWALGQARALARNGVDLSVISFTPRVPRIVGKLGALKTWALCPKTMDIEGLHVRYPRWFLYQGKHRQPGYADPRRQGEWCWFSAKSTLLPLCEQIKPHAVFCHHTLFNGYVAMKLQERTGVPFVTTDHSFREIEDCGRFPKRQEVFSKVASSAYRSVCVTSRMEDRMRRFVPDAKAITIHNGSEPVPDELRKTPRPKEIEGKTVVLLACKWFDRKGVAILVEAFSRVAQKYPDAVLRLVGDGPDRPAVDEAIRKSGLGKDRIQELGMRPHREVLQEMVWCDIYAMTSWMEPFATVYLEASSVGRPMIWGSDGGITDVLKDGVHGYGVEPKSIDSAAEALDRLLASPEDRQRMGQTALKQFEERLTWDANARAMRRLFIEAHEASASRA